MTIQCLSVLAKHLNLHKSNWIGILVWTIGVCGLGYQLVSDFLPLLDAYRFDNVETRIRVVRNEKTRPPRLTVCVPYHSESIPAISKWLIHNGHNDTENSTCLECEGLKNHSWDLWNQIDLGWKNDSIEQDDLEILLANALVTRILDKGTFDLLILKQSNFNWNQPLIDSIVYLMDCIFAEDHENVAGVTGLARQLKIPCRIFQTVISRLTRDTTNRLYRYLVDSLDIYLQLGGGGNNISMITPLSNRSSFVVAMGQICLPLLPNFVVENFAFNSFSDPIDPPWMRSKLDSPFTLWIDDSVLYATTFWLEAICNTGISKGFNVDNFKSIEIAFEINMKVMETRPEIKCIPGDGSRVECVVRRQLLDTVSLCGCVPFSYQHLLSEETDTLKLCNCQEYQKCKQPLLKTLRQHQEECDNKCENTFYKWTDLIAATHEESRDLEFRIFVPLQKSVPYVELVAKVKESPIKFLSQVGGIISLYLGLSGMSICAFIILLINLIRMMWQKIWARKRAKTAFEHQMSMVLENRAGQYVTRREVMEMQAEIMKNLRMMKEEIVREIKGV